MSRVDFGVKPVMYPMPVLIIGTYDENGVPARLDAVVLSTQHDPDVTQEQIHADVKKYIFFWLWDAERKRDESKQDDLSDDEIVDIREKAGFYGDEYMEELTEEELEKLDKHIQNLMREKKSKK